VSIDQHHVRTTKRALRQRRRELSGNTELSDDFTIEEVELEVKPGKAAGFDGVYPEFIRNSGRKTKEWLVSFFNDILMTGNLPKIFKRSKVIAIPKPGKDSFLC
jgi:hypothetical protein